MTIRDFCERQAFSRQWAYRLIGLGRLRVVKAGGRTLVTATEARRFETERKKGRRK